MDHRAFPEHVHVRVPLSVPNYDPGLWGGLETF
jgi:hypothetical protein